MLRFIFNYILTSFCHALGVYFDSLEKVVGKGTPQNLPKTSKMSWANAQKKLEQNIKNFRIQTQYKSLHY